MNKTPRAVMTWTKQSDDALLVFTRTVISMMTDNTNFPAPSPALPAIATAADTFAASIEQARTGNRTLIAVKNDNRDALTMLLRELTAYVNLVALGNKAILISSGLPVSLDPTPFVLDKPTVSLEDGNNKGEMVARARSNGKALNFQISTNPADETSWMPVGSNASTAVITGLAPVTMYYVRVEAVGTRGQRIYSDVAQRVAQ